MKAFSRRFRAALGLIALAAALGLGAKEPGVRVPLFNGRDLSGWKAFWREPVADLAASAKVADGVLHLSGKPNGYLRTEAAFTADYRLHVEWRWPEKPGNSGVIVHVTGADAIWPTGFEAQLAHGHAGDVVALQTTIDAPIVNNRNRLLITAAPLEKPAGEWNTYDIYVRGDTLETVINGTSRAVAKKLSAASGAICLQSEGAPIEFRNAWLEKL